MGITDSILLGGLSALAFIAALTWSPQGRSQRQRGQGTLRVLVAALSLSAAGFVGLAVHEGYTDRAVVPTQGDRPTVGFGSTFNEDGTPVKPGDTTTPVRALIKAQAHLSREETMFRTSLPGVALSQGEYDLYMDWLYQYGSGAWLKSGMRRELLAGNYRAACDALLDYRKLSSDQKEGPGWVVSRRNAQGQPTRWEFDCSTPGNRVCRGVWTRQLERHKKCMELQQ
ncbi:lysozyme [Ottowia sp.]|uniref:glycoside hydrolase family protein n=1 Tax=Ottowia sp. TaxID=1898956 RepID=UPI0025CD947B|nr:lysozyme [Ottowia sp.]